MPGLAYNYSGKVVLVTGSGSGIGRATALAFAQEGAWVAVSDLNEEGGLQTMEMILKNGGEATFFPCDVSNPRSIQNLVEHVEKRMGKIDSAFNNAGIEGEQALITECSEENWEKVINVNLRSIWLCMKYEISLMNKNGGGSIVNCASIAGLVGFPGIPAYVASKHGVIGLTKNAALEYAQNNIRVNAVCPGVIQTPMIDRFTRGDNAAFEQLVKSTPIGRIGKPEEIAAAVVWLCSEYASFVTGHALVADGGWISQ
ncbi:SDR family oxidoreductase [Bdellovibrio sp. BCCA]|uniref:SDR family oxidoreductase n=1 Tax=Bdellovibrio sp. BCCA TaxID=3136281 RepID=UPI0030F2BD5E